LHDPLLLFASSPRLEGGGRRRPIASGRTAAIDHSKIDFEEKASESVNHGDPVWKTPMAAS